MKTLHLILALLLLTFFSFAVHAADMMSMKGNRNVADFPEAKRLLPKVYDGHQTTLYCGCKYYGKELNLNSCGVYLPNAPKRLHMLEWEHVVPAARLGKVVRAWGAGAIECNHKKGRKCAEKSSALFRQMEGDLYNLYPESGGINGARSNKPPLESVAGNIKSFGSCETSVGKNGFVPRKAVRGMIGRTYLYMAGAYDLGLTSAEITQFRRWNELYPVDAWECERARRIQKIQGNPNPFVVAGCTKKGL
jgi:deoxyribonuclease-1